jgi:tetraacyldisaccharide 4'-kinase
MNLLRKILFPFALLYGIITSIRNFLFDKGILKSYSFNIPIIAVGNLSLGGTGKTPQIEYLIRLLSPKYKVATLSRGYKRKSKGFILADATSNAEILGDEPFQFFSKFPTIQVAVDADRKNGIEQLLSQNIKPDIILLDDAFQHRKVKAGFYILLTSFDELFINDSIFPMGNLRESRKGAKRANMIIVTKCPETISEIAKENIKKKIGLKVPIFFSYIDYDESVINGKESKKVTEIDNKELLVLAGIAKPEPFFKHFNIETTMSFPDHHHFSENDIFKIKEEAKNKLIVTTEKDFMRLSGKLPSSQLFYLPIKSSFLSGSDNFNKTITNYVESSSRNG